MDSKTIIEIIKLVMSSGTFLAAIVALAKYLHEKNREIYIRRLHEVYAPLFSYLVKQETVRSLYAKHSSIKEFPILTFESEVRIEKINFKREVEEGTTKKQKIIDRNDFIKVLNDTNKGLIKPRLLKLLSAYEILIYLEETLNVESEEWQIATEKKVKIEYELFKEVQIGYEETIRKLNLDDKLEIDNLEDFKL